MRLRNRDLPRVAYQDLVQEILNELLLEGSRGEKPMKIGSQEFRDKVTVWVLGIAIAY